MGKPITVQAKTNRPDNQIFDIKTLFDTAIF
jgi:hypothetical protein